MRTIEIPKHTVIQYIRDKSGKPRGALVAIKAEGGFGVGYSLCNKQDKFSKDMALKIAFGRALVGAEIQTRIVSRFSDSSVGNCIPHLINKVLGKFTDRCKKYYKLV
jgi:hypothetical protein